MAGGALVAVIDFVDLCSGDPASDLATAWMTLPRRCHAMFREAARADDDTWIRARAWALSLGLSFAKGDDRVAAIGRRALIAALAEG